MKKTFIIAEAGSNHNRSLEQAFKLIDVAKDAGCDAVKFQTYSSETLYVKGTRDPNTGADVSKMIKDIELPREWHKTLKSYSDEKGIEFMSTPFDEAAVLELVAIGVKRLKIAGFEAIDPRMVKLVAKTQLPLIISLGIGSNVETIEQILDWVVEENPKPDITFLHADPSTPTPYEDIHLLQIPKLLQHKSKIPFKAGLSDHTPGALVPALAVALGATVIEKHFTLSRKMKGPDHSFAIEPDELKQMVTNIRIAELCLEEKKGLYSKTEKKQYFFAMRSLVSKIAIKKGEQLTVDNVTTLRPYFEGAIPAAAYEHLKLYKAKEDIAENQIIPWDQVQKA